MSDETTPTSAWFRHKLSGQVFEAEGKQLAEARKNRDLEETENPETALRMQAEKLGVKITPKMTLAKLQQLVNDAQDALDNLPPA